MDSWLYVYVKLHAERIATKGKYRETNYNIGMDCELQTLVGFGYRISTYISACKLSDDDRVHCHFPSISMVLDAMEV